MSVLRFGWSAAKAAQNLRKHHVSIDAAVTVFGDEQARLIADPDHSLEENRFALLGLNGPLRLPVVVHCYRAGDDLIRLISARRAIRAEARQYG